MDTRKDGTFMFFSEKCPSENYGIINSEMVNLEIGRIT